MTIKGFISRLSLTAILLIVFCAVSLSAVTIQLPRGTQVKVKFAPGMTINSGKVEKDIPLLISLAEPIMVGSKTVVKAGAAGTATVVEAKKSGKVGKPGYIKVAFVDLEIKGDYKSAQTDKIKLQGEIENKGKGKKLKSLILGFGFFIKGGQGTIDANQTYTAEVAETIILEGE